MLNSHLSTNLFDDGFSILTLPNLEIINVINEVISNYIGNDIQKLVTLERTAWHKLVLNAQNELNSRGVLEMIASTVGSKISSFFPGEDLGYVNVVKLRAVRPASMINCQDHVPYHRETLYAKLPHQVKHQYNLWIPCTSSAVSSGLSFWPKSHQLSDDLLLIKEDPNHPCTVQRFSAGHAIGLPYKPKIIVNNKSDIAESLNVPIGSALIFSAMLVHGNGINRTNEVRYSVDTGILPASALIRNEELFAAGGKPHYIFF